MNTLLNAMYVNAIHANAMRADRAASRRRRRGR
jgi:hypothetical protein